MTESRSRQNQPLLLCYYYQQNICHTNSCTQLHLCKDILIDASHCPGRNCKSGFSHNPFDEGNSTILDRYGIYGDSEESVLAQLRRSFPRTCKVYNCKVKRSKCNVEDCNRLHICLSFLFDMCKLSSCKRSHDLYDSHNKEVLADFFLDKIEKKYFISANVLTKNLWPKKENNIACNDEINNGVASVTLKAKAESTSSDTKTVSSAVKVTSASFESIEQSHENDGASKVEAIFDTLRKLGDKASFYIGNKHVMNHFDGISPIPENLEKIRIWFESTFRLSGPDDTLLLKKVYSCVKDIKPCIRYWTLAGCKDEHCRSFHVCKEWLCGTDHSLLSCKLNHNLTSPREQGLVQGTYFERLTAKQLAKLLRNRYPYVCMENYKTCSAGELHCPNLHVCYDYLKGTCKKKEALCDHKHDSAFIGIQAVRLMKEYHIDKDDFKDAILIPKNGISKFEVIELVVEIKQDFDFLREAAICHHHAGNVCTLGGQCTLLHTKDNVPYLWQYRYQNTSAWNSLDKESSSSIEACYSDPANDSATIDDVYILFTYDLSKKSFTGTFQQNPAFFRRLSTQSNINASTEPGLTEWIWYWEKGMHTWEEYTKWVTGQQLEQYYLSDDVTRFTTDEFDYIISYERMEQQNIDGRYLTKRNIRRRPALKSCLRSEACSTPSHWPLNYPPGQRINVLSEKYKSLEREFKKSIKQHMYVLNVEEVCNEEFYEKYEGKKRTLVRKLGKKQVNERFLYHGTDDGSIAKVCAQNFDWRLCGKNGTAYGDGSYFARDASYSHNYTRPVGYIRYMFVASVLVGRSTKGSSGLKRPPPTTASETDLYDSCVDNIHDPSIFVIFERDQCYPKYLISYTDDDYCARTYRPPSTTLNPRVVTPRVVTPSAVTTRAGTSRAGSFRAGNFHATTPGPQRLSTLAVTSRTQQPQTQTSSCVIS